MRVRGAWTQWRAGTRGGSAISGARTVRGGGRRQGRGRCAVEGVDKGREHDIECADSDKGRERARCAVERRDKGRERDIGCADARWRAGARYRVCGRCAVEGLDKGRERDIGGADGARWT